MLRNDTNPKIHFPGSQERKRHIKHKQLFPVTARVGGGGAGLPTGWPGGLPTGGQGSKVYVLCAEAKEHKHFRPGTRPGGSVTRSGGSVTGVTEKLFMCQTFMCLFWPLGSGIAARVATQPPPPPPFKANSASQSESQTWRRPPAPSLDRRGLLAFKRSDSKCPIKVRQESPRPSTSPYTSPYTCPSPIKNCKNTHLGKDTPSS